MDRIYRTLLRLLPRDYDALGMWDTYRGRIHRARQTRGRRGATGEGLQEIADLLKTIVLARARPATLRVLLDEVRSTYRSLGRAPGFTAAIVLILGLGIGTSTAIFSAFRAVMVEDLPVRDLDRIVTVSFQIGREGEADALTAAEVEELGRASKTLDAAAGVMGAGQLPLAEGDRPLVLNMSGATPDFFDVLGVRPSLGRLFRPEDADPGAAPVAVISHRAWLRDFGGDRDVLGRALVTTHNQVRHVIVGVAPPGLDFPVSVDFWLPLRSNGLSVVARLAPEATRQAAQAEILSVAQELDRQRSRPRIVSGAAVRPFAEAVLGDARPILLAAAAAAALLLLIVCLNVGNLNLMRATGRTRDVMVRRALGASSGAVARLFLVESALLGMAGGVLGLLCAVGVLRGLAALAPARFPRAEMIALAGVPIPVTIAVSVFAVLVSGALPAYAAARSAPAEDLRAGGRSASGTVGRRRVRRTLVVTQVALAVVLLVGAGLLGRSLERLSRLDLGYDLDDVTLVELGIDRAGRLGQDETIGMLEGVLGRLRAIPGVVAATPLMSRPYTGWETVFRSRPAPEGQTQEGAATNELIPLEIGGGELFRTLGISIVRGRGLLDGDVEDSPRVVVVSEAVARRLWPGEDPIGKRMRVLSARDPSATVVGVAADTRFRWLRDPSPTVYMHWRQAQILPGVWTFAIRTSGDSDPVRSALGPAVDSFDSRLLMWRHATLRDHLARGPLAQPRATASLISGFGLAAVLLAAIGLYGLIALAVRERTHELGIRTALGATPAQLRSDVLRESLTIAVAGVAVGLIGSLAISRGLAPLLFDVGPSDPLTLLGACGVLLSVSLVAAYVPAGRATRVDPRRALSAE
jgi:putative ABC transport system permease protein